jgi:hypothetical protein
MLGLYYRIWVDCIKRAQSQPANKQIWPRVTILIMSVCMAFNLLLIMFVLQKYVFKRFFYIISVDSFPSQINYLLSFTILFFLPCIGINYLLIFINKRYENLLKKYKYYNGRLFLVYMLVSLLLPIILVWTMFVFQ